MFKLHPQLEADTRFVTDLPVCRVLLMNNSLFSWLILVPRGEGYRDLFDVPPTQQGQMVDDIKICHEALKQLTHAEKMNVGALGNMVPQLHIHIVARQSTDACWPAPVWGGPAQPYEDEAASTLCEDLLALLQAAGVDTPPNLA